MKHNIVRIALTAAVAGASIKQPEPAIEPPPKLTPHQPDTGAEWAFQPPIQPEPPIGLYVPLVLDIIQPFSIGVPSNA
jgi:hypothetical protein